MRTETRRRPLKASMKEIEISPETVRVLERIAQREGRPLAAVADELLQIGISSAEKGQSETGALRDGDRGGRPVAGRSLSDLLGTPRSF